MDCCICSPMATVYRPPRNTVCSSCHEGAKAIIAFLDDVAGDGGGGEHGSVKRRGRSMKPNSSAKGMKDAWEEVKATREREEEERRRAAFLAMPPPWRHTDIAVNPGSGPPIPAHKAVLAARSEVFRHILSGGGEDDGDGGDDRCKAPAGDSISLPELDHGELSRLLAFLYTGELEADGGEDDQPSASESEVVQALLVAADKYDVGYLARRCEAQLVAAGVDAGNVLRTLEVAELSSSAALKEAAMAAVVEHAEQVVFSPEYGDFALRNAALCVDITRALLLNHNNSSKR